MNMPHILQQSHDVAFTFHCEGAPPNVLRVRSFSAMEQIFGLHSIEVELAAPVGVPIDLHALNDQPATLIIHNRTLGIRHLSGVVAGISRRSSGVHTTYYAATIMPTLHCLRYGSDCRIFQQMTVPDIIRKVFGEYGVTDVEWALSGVHDEREYCVQYRETHLDFLERLMAEEGIWYFFSHGPEGQHRLHVLDTPPSVPTCPDQAKLLYKPVAGGIGEGAWCHGLTVHEEIRPTMAVQRDYTFKRPAYDQHQTSTTQADNGSQARYEMYNYPGRYKVDSAGEPFTRTRLEAMRVGATIMRARANTPHLVAGHVVELTGDGSVPPAPALGRYHILSVSHGGTQPQAEGPEAGGGSAVYDVAFTAMPADLPYRPPVQPQPLVAGPQIAKVVGPAGEEIYTDEHGRVKVQFPWDRYGKSDEHSSCWVRVSNNWSGGGWGHIAIPRIGHEVIVDFLEGDPDQPIITGRTYHAANRPPYVLPKNKTRMVLRSDTHKGQGYNELSFEDEAGQENIFLHAQKDHTLKILNNRVKRVGANQAESVGANKSISVGGNHSEAIDGSMTLSIGGGAGAGALVAGLAALMSSSASQASESASKVGNPMVSEVVAGLGAAQAAVEAAATPAKAQVSSAAGHLTAAGGMQAAAGAALGGLLSKIMPIAGIFNTVVEKIKSDTIGLMRTEQIGLFKNTMVGHTQHTTVGKYKKVVVGDEYVIEVGKSRLVMDKDGNVTLTGTKFNFTASGPVQINGKVIDLN